MNYIFIHGWGFSKEIFKDYFYIDNSDFLDLPFHGDMSDFVDKNILENYVNYLSSKIYKDTTLIGWSLGATVSLLTALKNENVKKLVLIGFSPKFNDEKLGSSPVYIKAFLNNLNKDFSSTLSKFRKAAIDKEINSIPKPKETGAKALLREFINLDITDILSKINIPTIILHGTDDKIVNKEAAFFSHEKIQDSQLFLVESHHGPFLERDIFEFINE